MNTHKPFRVKSAVKHEPTPTDPAKAEARLLRNNPRWAKLSARVLRDKPWCCDPFGHHRARNILEPARQAHHIRQLSEHPELAFVRTNLASVCYSCHGKLNSMEKKGEPLHQAAFGWEWPDEEFLNENNNNQTKE